MSSRRGLAAFTITLFVLTAVVPLTNASTEQTFNGDVVVNGAFRDATPRGHPMKFYCGANNPGAPIPECAHQNEFVAYDWTAPVESLDGVSLVAGGIRVSDPETASTPFIQQHFNGSEAPDRPMKFFGVSITGRGETATASGRVDIRYGTAIKTVNFNLPVGGATVTKQATDFGFTQGQLLQARSVRVWIDSGSTAIIERVSVYATNGIDGRNLLIMPAGDDATSSLDVAMLQNPGADGKYSFLVGMAADNGEFLPTRNAWGCLFDAETAMADRGYPQNLPSMCMDAYLKPNDPAMTKTRVGDAWRIDIDAAAIAPWASSVGATSFYAIVEVDPSYDIETPGVNEEFKSGYFHAGRVAAATLGHGVSQEFYGPTPIVLDGNADGIPDTIQIDEADGYSVIISPLRATITPALAVVTPDIHNNYDFEVQVYAYEGATGAPMDIPGGISFGLFDAAGYVNGGAFDASPLWQASGSDITRVDAKTLRVTVPVSEVPANTPLGAWAYYDVGATNLYTITTPYWGPSDPAFDFYSATRGAVKEFAVADALRTQATPILLDAASRTGDATIVIRADPDADVLTPLDGTLVVGDGGDGTVSFEYAMIASGNRVLVGSQTDHALAIYDAGGILSDDLQPGTRNLEHAEWWGSGVATADGWYRVDIPVSAFADAKGAVGVWAYVDNTIAGGYVLSRSTYYNLAKPEAASLSPTAAEKTLYGPTPVVILDNALGIPKALASAIAGAGATVLSVTNPLVNPGFEADLIVEGHNDAPDKTGGTMSAPPWFFRLDDMGTGQPTNPRSTHEVVHGAGQLGDSALRIYMHHADRNKGLMLGQHFGTPNDESGLVWVGATGVRFDARITQDPVTFKANLRYLNADGTIGLATGTRALMPIAVGWQSVSIPLAVPADAQLLTFYLQPDAGQTLPIVLDNVAIQGAKTTLGDARTDLTDGFAVIIEPQELRNGAQSLVRGADGDYYLYDVSVMDYTQGPARLLPVDGVARSFGLREADLTVPAGITLKLRHSDDHFVGVVPASEAPDSAIPYAWVDAGGAYNPLSGPIEMQPAAGHYSPTKNAMAGAPLADSLDHVATPVAFGTSIARTQIATQQLQLVALPGGDHEIFVTALSPFVETTTVTVTAPGQPPRSASVTLARDIGDRVPGLVIGAAELPAVTITSADTRFTRGATLVAGSPAANFEVCRVALPGCVSDGISSGEQLSFRSTSASPSGESLTKVWKFGDGTTGTTANDLISKTYATPGVKIVNLTVETPSGKKSSIELPVSVNNRGPTIAGIDVTPSPIFTDSAVTIRARASDPDQGTLAYAWKIDGVSVSGPTTATLRLTPAILEATTGSPALAERDYAVDLTVTDGQGGLVSAATSFTVVDRPAQVGTPGASVVGLPSATYALVGETIRVTVTVSDDDAVSAVLHTGLFDVPLAPAAPGLYAAEFSVPNPASLTLAAEANGVTGAPSTFEVRADAPTTVSLQGPALVQAGDSGTFTVLAIDPDGRPVGAPAWSVDGAPVPGDENMTHVFAAVGTSAVQVIVDGVADVLDVDVDDVIRVSLEMVDPADSITEGHIMRVRVVDTDGAPLANIAVVIEDHMSPLPQPLSVQTVHTDANGEAVFRVAPEGQLVALPLSHTIRATASAPSAPGAPVQDEETATAEHTYRNGSGPYEGLPLP